MRKEKTDKTVKIMKKTVGMLVLALGVLGSSMTSYAAQEKEVYVYHCHTGDETSGGGCYKEPVYHQHQGDEASGGKCYETPVYHTHTGNQRTGGGCYQQPIYHAHEGDGTAPTACYTAVYHEHAEGCYKEVDYDDDGCYIVNYWDSYENDYTDSSGTFHDYKNFEMKCGRTIYGTNAYHRHKVLNCKKEGVVEKYELCCGKTPETVEGYTMNCGKTLQTVVSYRLSCPKTKETIEKYERNCQKDETSPYGIMRVSATGEQNNQRAVLRVGFSDLTGGELFCRAEDFSWQGAGGIILGRGTGISVSENGTYRVTLALSHENVTPRELCAEVQVNFIVKPTPPAQEENSGGTQNTSGQGTGNSSSVQSTPSKDAGNSSGMQGTPSPDTGSSSQGTGTGTGSGGNTETSTNTSINTNTNKETAFIKKTPVVLPTITPVLEMETEAEDVSEAELFHFPEKDLEREVLSEESENGDEAFSISQEVMEEPEISAQLQEELLQEREEQVIVEVPGRQSEGGSIGEIQTLEVEKGSSFFGVKVILLAAVIIFITLGMAAGIFLLWRSVAIYNDDGEGNLFYIGRSLVYSEDGAYVISITDRMREKSETNKYCIKPGIFLLGREMEEIIVERGHKRISAELKKEMNIII